jgi:3-hydroxyanthranilate 3,4-dioxygenase
MFFKVLAHRLALRPQEILKFTIQNRKNLQEKIHPGIILTLHLSINNSKSDKIFAMPVLAPFNLKKWIDENRDLLKPPVGNQCVYKDAENFIVMVVGGPNARKDYHFNETEELYYQVEGDIVVKIIDNGEFKDIPIKEGEMFLLPPKTPHSPQRGPNTVGLVIEKKRESEDDGFMWFCENCGNKLYEEALHVDDIVKQLPPVMNRFWEDTMHRTCEKCGTVMEPPVPPRK